MCHPITADYSETQNLEKNSTWFEFEVSLTAGNFDDFEEILQYATIILNVFSVEKFTDIDLKI